jgi:predicted protein tyrosine phosphatase
MKIKVFNEDSIRSFKTEEKHVVVSFQDPNYEFVNLPEQSSRLAWIGFHCYDLEDDCGQFPYSRYLFEHSHAKELLNFVNIWKDKVNLIIVNCVAGVSRSMGAAAAISKILNGEDAQFFKEGYPNMRIYRLLLEEHFGPYFKDFSKTK